MDADMMGSTLEQTDRRIHECERPIGKEDPVVLNPRNYAFMPYCYTTQIRPAGKFVNKSADIKEVFIA
jgi:hypothetical protein